MVTTGLDFAAVGEQGNFWSCGVHEIVFVFVASICEIKCSSKLRYFAREGKPCSITKNVSYGPYNDIERGVCGYRTMAMEHVPWFIEHVLWP